MQGAIPHTRSENPLEQEERIHRRVGLTGPDRLRWAVTFAQHPWDSLSPGERLDLLLELRDFLYYQVLPWQRKAGSPRHSLSGSPSRTIMEADALEVQKDSAELITTLLTVGFIVVEVSQSIGLYRVERQPGQCAIVSEAMTDSLTTVFIHRLLPLLEAHGDLLKVCPECQHFFLRGKKRQFCSPRCQTRAYMRRYRTKDDVRSQEAEQSHQRYAKRTKERSGGKAQRRPRKGGTAR